MVGLVVLRTQRLQTEWSVAREVGGEKSAGTNGAPVMVSSVPAPLVVS